jgi:hypothetical protein
VATLLKQTLTRKPVETSAVVRVLPTQLEFDFSAKHILDGYPDLMSPYDLTEVFSVTLRTVANWRMCGIIPSVQISARVYRFPKSEIRKFIEKRFKHNTYIL